MRKHLAIALSVAGLAGSALAEDKPVKTESGSKSKAPSKTTVKQEAVRDQNASPKATKEMNKTEGVKGGNDTKGKASDKAITKGKAGDSKANNAQVTKR